MSYKVLVPIAENESSEFWGYQHQGRSINIIHRIDNTYSHEVIDNSELMEWLTDKYNQGYVEYGFCKNPNLQNIEQKEQIFDPVYYSVDGASLTWKALSENFVNYFVNSAHKLDELTFSVGDIVHITTAGSSWEIDLELSNVVSIPKRRPGVYHPQNGPIVLMYLMYLKKFSDFTVVFTDDSEKMLNVSQLRKWLTCHNIPSDLCLGMAEELRLIVNMETKYISATGLWS